jgi:O-antigen/teichoic acid export membrane protein
VTVDVSPVERLWKRLFLPIGDQWIASGQLYSARLVGQAVGLALTVVSARVLQPGGRGEFVTVSAGAVIGAQALNLGLSSSLAVLFSRRPHRIGRYRRYLVALAAAWAVLLVAVGTIGSWAGPGTGSPFRWWPFWAAWIPLQLLGLYQGAALLARQDGQALSRIELTGRCSAMVLGGASLLAFGDSLPPFLTSIIAADGIIAVLGARHLARVAPGAPPRRVRPFLKEAARMGLRAYPPLVLFFLLVKSDILVLRTLRGAAETGVYSIASQVVDVALILPATIGALALPRVVRAKRPAAELLRVLRPTAFLVGALAILIALFGHWGIVSLFGRPYEGAYPALLLLLPGLACLGLQGLLGQYFAARGFPAFVSFYWFLGFATNLTLNLLLVPHFGLLAAAATSSVGYGLVFFLMWRRFLADRRAESAL